MLNLLMPNEEKEHLASLHRAAILDTSPDTAVDRLAALAARLFEMPLAFVTLVEEDRLWFKSCQGICGHRFKESLRRETAFCAQTLVSRTVFMIEDASLDPRFADHPVVVGEPRLRFYAGAPLLGSEGQVLGTLCVMDFQPRILTAMQQRTLQDLAASVVSELDLRRSAATLAESEKLYRQMFEDSPLPMWVFEVETLRFLAVNDTAILHFGYSREEFLARRLSDLRHPEDIPAMLCSLQTDAASTRFAGVSRNFKKNGELVWTDIVSHAIMFEGCAARLAVATDITERKNAEAALQRSLSVLKAQQEAALDGILVVDENRRIISYNQRLCELWNTPPEIIQSGDDEKHLAYALSLLQNPDEFLQRVMYLYEHPTETSRDEVALRDGRTLDRYSGPIVSENGNSYGRIWYFRDVTEHCRVEKALRQSEQRLSLHVQQTPLAVLEVAADMTILSWNPAAENTFGYTAQEAVGQNVAHLLVPPEEHAHLETVRQGLLTQSGGRRSTNHNRTKSGEVILCEWYNTPLVNETGQAIGCASLARDVTDEYRAQEELRLNEALMEEAQRVAHIGSWDYDLSTGKSSWTREMFHLLELDPAQGEPDYNTNVALYHPDDAAHLQRCVERAVREGNGYELDIRMAAQNTQFPHWLHAIGRPAFDAEGKVTRLFGTLIDITEQKRLEAERESLLVQTETLLAEALAQADRDPLTGLLNHRVFHKRLKEEADAIGPRERHFAVLLLDLENFKFFNEVYGHQAGDDVLRQLTQALQSLCRKDDVLARFGGDEFALLLPEMDRAAATRRAEDLRAAASLVSYQPPGYETTIPFNFSVGLACFPEDGSTRTALLEAASNRLRIAKSGGEDGNPVLHLRQNLSQSFGGFTMLDALVTAVDNKDRYTRRHSEDVLQYSLQIAETLGLDAKVQQTVKVAALLHDVGKIGVPDMVLRKPGTLTDDEFEAIKQHPMMGAIIVGAVPGFEETLDAIRHHHERWDGGGYPFGLRGDETPLIARLMAVADAYSAMTTDRPYRKGMAEARALRILEEGSGTQWDPSCIHAFFQARSVV